MTAEPAADLAGAAVPVAVPDAAPSADDVVRATERARAGGDPARWPDKLPVRDRLAVLFDPGSFVEDGLLATAMDAGQCSRLQ